MGSGELGVKAAMTRLPEASSAGGRGETTVNINIDARGADREGLREVKAEVRELRNVLVRVYRSIEPRALRAWAETRRRGGFR